MTHTMNKPATLGRTLCKALGAAVITLSVVAAGTVSAEARNLCMKRADMTGVLKKHKEAQASIGLASNGSLIEVYSTADGGSWSIVMTNPQGTSCVVAVGKDWDNRAPVVLGDAT